MAASNLASVSPCPKVLRSVIKPSTFTCSAPALGQPENEGDDREPDQHANPESTRHVVTYACGIHDVHTTIGFRWRARYPPNGSRKTGGAWLRASSERRDKEDRRAIAMRPSPVRGICLNPIPRHTFRDDTT